MLAPDLRSEFRWLSSGFLLMLFSGFGQTYFIALFAGQLKSELGIGDGQFGSLYAAGTIASAILLVWSGRFADSLGIRWLGAGVTAGLGLTAAAMAFVATPGGLLLVIFGLRFFGQGMLTHTAMTAMGRWFNRKRGRAVAVAGLGLPASEGLLPPLAVALTAAIGWREAWLAVAALLLLVAAPALVVILRHERHPTRGPVGGRSAAAPAETRRQWSRSDVLRHPPFYGVLTAVLAPPFVITAIFFNQVTLVQEKDWTLAWFAGTFPLLAGAHVITAPVAGVLIDRHGARRLPWVYLVSLALACWALGALASPWSLAAVMILLGLTLGFASAITNALWPELYGAAHLGAIRAVVTAAVVLSTALAPGLVGILLDAGVALSMQLHAMAVYCLAAAAAMAVLLPRLDEVARGG